jgi:sporulation protein YlmC with PRC-barrel domain
MNETVRPNNTPLEKLKDAGLELADRSQDIRGRKVVDASGTDIGHVSGLFIDEGERKVRMLEVSAGGFLGVGDHHVLVPVEAITSVEKDQVHVNETRDRVIHSPAYNPQIVEPPTNDFWGPYYGYYGMSPYWGSGYRYPNFGMWP